MVGEDMTGKTFELDNGEKYIAVSTTIYENDIYVILAHVNSQTNEIDEDMEIAKCIEGAIEFIDDDELKNRLLPMFDLDKAL